MPILVVLFFCIRLKLGFDKGCLKREETSPVLQFCFRYLIHVLSLTFINLAEIDIKETPFSYFPVSYIYLTFTLMIHNV